MKDVIVITPLGPLKGLNCLVLIVLISHGSTHAPGKIDRLLSRVLILNADCHLYLRVMPITNYLTL